MCPLHSSAVTTRLWFPPCRLQHRLRLHSNGIHPIVWSQFLLDRWLSHTFTMFKPNTLFLPINFLCFPFLLQHFSHSAIATSCLKPQNHVWFSSSLIPYQTENPIDFHLSLLLSLFSRLWVLVPGTVFSLAPLTLIRPARSRQTNLL